jgi:hypothetical protein
MGDGSGLLLVCPDLWERNERGTPFSGFGLTGMSNVRCGGMRDGRRWFGPLRRTD